MFYDHIKKKKGQMTGKYNNLKILKEAEARSFHVCDNCGEQISPGEIYYREHVENKFLHSLHAKKYCSSCFEKYGDGLLSMAKSKKTPLDRTLDDFYKNQGKI